METALSEPYDVVCYHGTTLERASNVIREGTFPWRDREGDWLGGGTYFFQEAPARAWRWAEWVVKRLQRTRPELGPQEPAVLHALVRMTHHRMDLLDDSPWASLLAQAYQALEKLDRLPPQSSNLAASVPHPLDYAVISLAAKVFAIDGSIGFERGRAAFIEGEALYPGSALFSKAHVQVVVRSTDVINDLRLIARLN